MAVDAAPMPQHEEVAPWLIVLAASSDGIAAIGKILAALPKDLPASVIVVQHRTSMVPDLLTGILRMRALMPVQSIGHGQPVEPGAVYVVRPDLHLTIDADRRFKYIDGTRVKHLLSSADPLLESVARAYRSRAIAVVLTGRGEDASDGIKHIRAHGGLVIAQDPETIEFQQMPAAAIATGQVNAVLPLDQIAPRLVALVRQDGAAREALEVASSPW